MKISNLRLSRKTLPWVALTLGAVVCGCTPAVLSKSKPPAGSSVSPEFERTEEENVDYQLNVDSQKLGDLPPQITKDNIYVSADGQHFYYTTAKGGRPQNWIDLKPSADDFDDVTSVQFSSAGGHYAYVGYRAGVPYVVYDGKEQRIATGEDVGNFHMSDDGESIAVQLRHGWKYRMLYDGKLTDQYGNMLNVKYSPDGKSFGFIGIEEGQESLVVNGDKIFSAERISSFEFNPATNEPIIVASDADGRFVSYGEQRINLPSPSFTSVQFSSNGQHYAIQNFPEEGEAGLWIDGELQSDAHHVDSFVFSSDGKHHAYVMLDNSDQRYIVIDGQRTAVAHPTSLIGFLADQRLVAVIRPTGKPTQVVAGDTLLVEHDTVNVVEISPGAKHVYYVIGEGDQFRYGVDESISEPCDTGWVQFAADDTPLRLTEQDGKSSIEFNEHTIIAENLRYVSTSTSGKLLWFMEESDGETTIRVVDESGNETSIQVAGTPLMPGFLPVLRHESDLVASALMLEGQTCSRITFTLHK